MNKYSRAPGDSILALLEPGEYVLNRNAVNEIGKENLDELNFEDYPRFDMSERGQMMMAQTGGMLGDMVGYQTGGMPIRKAEYQEPDMNYVNIASLDYPRYDKHGQYYKPDLFQKLGDKYYEDYSDIADLMFGKGRNEAARGIFHSMGMGTKRADEYAEKLGATEYDKTLARKYNKALDDLEESYSTATRNIGQDYYAYKKGVRPKDMLSYPESLYDEKQLNAVKKLLSKMSDSKLYKDIKGDYIDVKYRNMPSKYGIESYIQGFQEGGTPKNKGLAYAEEYEYNPTSIQKLLDKLPGIGGKRAYDRARDYQTAVHFDPEMLEDREKMMDRGINVTSKNIRNMMSDFGETKQNEWKSKTLVKALEDPRNFRFKNTLINDGITDVNQYIMGLETGHTVTEDGKMKYAIDPHNIAKSNPGKNLLGLIPFGYSGSVKANPGIDPYIDPKSLMGQISGMTSGGAITYGDATSTLPDFADIYKQMGIMPNQANIADFESAYKYDPNRESVHFEDFSRAIDTATRGAQQNLSGITQAKQQQQAKAGFAGAGSDTSQVRGSIMDDFLSQQAASQSSLFKAVRGEREAWAEDAAAGIKHLDSLEGTTRPGQTGWSPGGDETEYGSNVGTTTTTEGDCTTSCEQAKQSCIQANQGNMMGMQGCNNAFVQCMSGCS